jgi:hypothetical protein
MKLVQTSPGKYTVKHDPTLMMVAGVARKMGKKMPNGQMDYSKAVKKASKLLRLPGER